MKNLCLILLCILIIFFILKIYKPYQISYIVENLPFLNNYFIMKYSNSLSSNDIFTRRKAALHLSFINHHAVCDILIQLLKDNDLKVRSDALSGLRKFKEKEAFDNIIECLKISDMQIRIKAIILLEDLKDKRAVKYLVDLLDDSDTIVRNYALSALMMFEDPEIVDILIREIKKADDKKKIQIIRYFEKVNDERIIIPLKNELNNNNNVIRELATKVLKDKNLN